MALTHHEVTYRGGSVRVRSAVQRSGMTKAQFAASVGTSASRLSTYLSGKVVPSAALLMRIERTADRSLDGHRPPTRV